MRKRGRNAEWLWTASVCIIKTGIPEALWLFPSGNLNLSLPTLWGKLPTLSPSRIFTEGMDTFARATLNEKGDCSAPSITCLWLTSTGPAGLWLQAAAKMSSVMMTHTLQIHPAMLIVQQKAVKCFALCGIQGLAAIGTDGREAWAWLGAFRVCRAVVATTSDLKCPAPQECRASSLHSLESLPCTSGSRAVGTGSLWPSQILLQYSRWKKQLQLSQKHIPVLTCSVS